MSAGRWSVMVAALVPVASGLDRDAEAAKVLRGGELGFEAHDASGARRRTTGDRSLGSLFDWAWGGDDSDDTVYCYSYLCGLGKEHVRASAGVACNGGICDDDTCCEDIVYCDSHECSAGLELVADYVYVPCVSRTCDDSQCCIDALSTIAQTSPTTPATTSSSGDEVMESPEVDATPAPASLVSAPIALGSACEAFGGISSSMDEFCCVPSCGKCGGRGCSEYASHGTDVCCTSVIAEAGVACREAGVAPCVNHGDVTAPTLAPTAYPTAAPTVAPTSGMLSATTSPAAGTSTCDGGIPGLQSGDVCCVAQCGQCGGAGCGTLSGLTSAECCTSTIAEAGDLCAVTGAAPCLMSGDFPPDGENYVFKGCYEFAEEDPFFVMDAKADMTPDLCYKECLHDGASYMGLFGGDRCGCGKDTDFLLVQGGFGSCETRCTGNELLRCGGVRAFDLYKFVDAAATDAPSSSPTPQESTAPTSHENGLATASPMIEQGTEGETCSNGFEGIEKSGMCCVAQCGQCGGPGCSSAGGLTAEECCTSSIESTAAPCSAKGQAPCVLDDNT